MRGFAGEHRVQVELLEEALEVARESGDFALEASLYQRIGWAWGLAGNNRLQLEWTERGIDFCRAEPERAGAVSGFGTWPWLLCQRGLALLYMGRFDEAEPELRRGHALAEARDDQLTMTYAEQAGFAGARLRGDLDRMRTAASTIDVDADYPSVLVRFLKVSTVAESLIEAGQYAEAAETFERLSGDDMVVPIIVFEADRLAQAGQAHCALGDWEAASRAIAECQQYLRERPELRDSMPFLINNLGNALLDLRGHEAAEEVVALCDTHFESLEERGWGAHVADMLRLRGRARALLGDREAAEQDLRAARERYSGMSAPRRVDEVDEALSALV
jgi:tetratricopeptide (TPR) repeat protein